MVIRELTYQLHKLEASESALVSADHHDKKSVLGIGGKNPDRSIPSLSCIITDAYDMFSAVYESMRDGVSVCERVRQGCVFISRHLVGCSCRP